MNSVATPRAIARDRGPLLVALAFFVLGVVWLGSSARYHGDERYYTDAALRMLENGDWFTPEYADGSARLNKPLLSYWILAVSFASSGVSLFVARFAFLLAGAATVFLAGRLARELFASEPRAPLLAAAITAANVEVLTLARRSTPDVLLVLSVTVAWIGLARILVAREVGRGAAWWFWIGVGAAVAVKGALGLLLVAFALGATFALRRGGARVRDLFAPAAILVAVAMGAVGLAPQWLAARAPGGANLFDDQVGDRVASSLVESVTLFARYGESIGRHTLPWSLFALAAFVGARGDYAAALRRLARPLLLSGAFVLLLWVVFSLGNTHRGRYLTPAYPLASAALAALVLAAFDAERMRATLRRGARALVLFLGVASLVGAALLVRVDLAAAASCAVGALVAFAPALRASERGSSAPRTADGAGTRGGRDDFLVVVRLALVVCAVSTVGVDGVRAALDPSPVVPAARAARLDATLGFTAPMRGHVRVASGGRLDPVWLDDSSSDDELRAHAVILVTGAARERVEALSYRLEPCGYVARSLAPRDALELLRADDPRAWLAARGQPVWIATAAHSPR